MRYVKLLVFLFLPFFSLFSFKYILSHELKKKYYLYHPIYFLELDKQKSLVYNNDCTIDWVWRNMIAISPLTGRIYQGKINKAGDAFVGTKKDITSDVLRIIIEKAEFHGGSFEITTNNKKWTITVEEN